MAKCQTSLVNKCQFIKCLLTYYKNVIQIFCFPVNINAFAVGTAITWSSPMLEKLNNIGTDSPFDNEISEEEQSWISASFNLGAALSPFVFGNLVDRIGRKYTILGTGITLLLGYLLMAFVKFVACFCVARFLCGCSAGGVFNVIPVYIAEIADNRNRGTISSLLNLLLCGGMLFTYCVGPYVSVKAFNILLSIFPAIFLISFFIVGTESPYYYIKQSNPSLAKEALQKIRGHQIDVQCELDIISKTIAEEGEGTFFDIFKTKASKRAFIISLGLVIFQQFSGIIAVLYYAQTIFKQAKVNLDPAICSIILGAVQFAVSFTTPVVIDKLGRKILLYVSAVGMVLSQASLGIFSLLREHEVDVSSISIFSIICLLLYIITYNFGFGPLAWTVMGELFPSNVKSAATITSTFCCWFIGFLVAKYFQLVASSIGMGAAFLIFSTFCGISIAFIHFFVIETKGKTLQQIINELGS